MSFQGLSDDECVRVLVYLTARELSALSLVDKTVFCERRVSHAIKTIMGSSLMIPLTSPLKRQQTMSCSVFTAAGLFVFDTTNMLAALAMPAPMDPRHGMWISSCWCLQLKRHFETVSLPSLLPKVPYCPISPVKRVSSATKSPRTPGKKTSSQRLRHATPSAPVDLLCEHGGLALAAVSCKRRLIDRRAWRVLKRSFPDLLELPGTQSECVLCREMVEDERLSCERRRDAVLASRRSAFVSAGLEALAQRKSGVPTQCTTAHWLSSAGMHGAVVEEEFAAELRRPLLPGRYNLVPRQWLRHYRRFLREVDTIATTLPLLDCTGMLCYSHGLLRVPRHVEEYLVGVRRSLLANVLEHEQLDAVEIVTAEEWDELQRVIPGSCDFNVRFSVRDDYDLEWNVALCQVCDPSIPLSATSPARATMAVSVI